MLLGELTFKGYGFSTGLVISYSGNPGLGDIQNKNVSCAPTTQINSRAHAVFRQVILHYYLEFKLRCIYKNKAKQDCLQIGYFKHNI